MQIDEKLIGRVAAGLEVLNFSEENDRVASLNESAKEVRVALEKAHARHGEIIGELADAARLADVSGVLAANALIEGASPSEAVCIGSSKQDLERERDVLWIAAGELKLRADDIERSIRSVKNGAKRRIGEVARPLVDAIVAEARKAAQTIVDCNTSLRVLGLAGNFSSREMIAVDGAVRDGLIGPDSLIDWQDSFSAPVQIASLLSVLNGKGAALPNHQATRVPSR